MATVRRPPLHGLSPRALVYYFRLQWPDKRFPPAFRRADVGAHGMCAPKRAAREPPLSPTRRRRPPADKRAIVCSHGRSMCLAWSEMTRPVFESAPDGLVPPEQQIDRLNRVAPVHRGPPHPPQADVVASRMQATWPFFGACRLAGSEERSAAVERTSVFSPRSLSIFRPCRSSRQGAVLLGNGGVSLHGNAKQIPGVRPWKRSAPQPQSPRRARQMKRRMKAEGWLVRRSRAVAIAALARRRLGGGGRMNKDSGLRTLD